MEYDPNPDPPASVVVLTKDEAANIVDCLDAVCAQLAPRDEVLVIDSASRDGTVDLARRVASGHEPARVRVHASELPLTFGAARNLAISLAQHDVIVFLSADAVPERGWLDAIRGALRDADIVYGRQKHAPTRENLATVSRGLRYRHFESPREALPETYASNVNAAYQRYAFTRLRFDEKAAGAEDVAFAKAARLAGLRLAYAPHAVVRHKDVATLRAEWLKHAREGEAYAQLRTLLGFPTLHLAWALCVAGLAMLTFALGQPWLLVPTIVVFFAPTLRRLATPAVKRYHALPLAAAALASPFFDLAFIGSYVKKRVMP